MSYDALVWLLVGLGVGVAGSLMLLMAYAGLERARLGGRLRKARAAVPIAPEAKPAPVERPSGSKLDMAKTTASKPLAMQPVPEETGPTPVQPALAAGAAVTLEPIVTPAPSGKAAEREVAPAVTPTLKLAAPLGPGPVRSVEALFAEAFANDKLPAPEPGEKST